MDLVIQLYTYDINDNNTSKKIRQNEINECFIRNIKNTIFSSIHVLLEKESDLEYYKLLVSSIVEKTKCVFTIFGKQPTYSDLIMYANNNIEADKIVCIMNSDIFMGNTTIEFINKELNYNTFISLTRHEFTDEAHSSCNVNTCHLIYKYHGSHDAFIFKTPIPEDYNYDYVNIPQNVGGSEAIFMKSWVMVGKHLKNLCFDIPIYHMHKNHYRLFTYKILATHELCNIPPTVPEGRSDIQLQIVKMF
jgi:hypothetical protein